MPEAKTGGFKLACTAHAAGDALLSQQFLEVLTRALVARVGVMQQLLRPTTTPDAQGRTPDLIVQPVEVAPTMSKALGLRPEAHQAVRMEHARLLPGLGLED